MSQVRVKTNTSQKVFNKRLKKRKNIKTNQEYKKIETEIYKQELLANRIAVERMLSGQRKESAVDMFMEYIKQ